LSASPSRPAVAGRWLRWGEAALALGLGALQTLAFVHTTWAWALPIGATAWLVWRLDGARPGQAALLGWCYGTAWLCAGVWWLFISMNRYGPLSAPLAALAVLVLSGALSLYLAAAAAAYVHWRRGRAGDAALFAALWLLAELARGVVFTGFPWAAAGYAQIDSPLVALAPWVGVYGIGAAVAYGAAASVWLLRTRGRVASPMLVLVALVLGAGALADGWSQPAGTLSVQLLQTNVSQDEKFAADRMPDALAWTANALRGGTAELIVAPETAVPLLPAQLEDLVPGYWKALREHFAAPGRHALVGVPLGDFDVGYTNSVVGLSAKADYRYDKFHLVPFGEFVPWGFRWFTEVLNFPLGDFNRGVRRPPSFAVGAQRVAPNICYEDLFGEELAQRFGDPAAAPTVMANVSNIGWFGPSTITVQHLNISRMRTREFERPMLRATNTGATAIIDHRGRVSAELPAYTQGVLSGRVEGRSGLTPFACWAAWAGLWPLAGLGVGVCLWARRRPADQPWGG
jgi:apolipoprotein N-acyltransferase